MVADENGVEHFWFTPFKEMEDGFRGGLANEPSTIRSLQVGEVYGFAQDQITDWGYKLNGKQYGSYTICALFQSMEPEVVERYKKDHGFVCES